MSVAGLARRAQAAWTNPRLRKRFWAVATHSANSLLVPLLSPLVAALVVRLAGVGLWGGFVRVLLVAQFASHVVVWGNKDYVLRQISRNPAQMTAAWQTSLFTRLLLFAAAVAALLLFGYGPVRLGLIVLFTLALVLAQAFEVLVLYRRDFAFALGVEVAGIGLLAATVLALRGILTVEALLVAYAAASLLKAGLLAWRYRAEVGRRRAGAVDFGCLRAAWPFFLLGFSGLLQSRLDIYAVSAWLPPEQTGRYQVYTNLLLYLQSVAAFVLVPFVNSLYRLSYRSLLGLSLKLLLFGVLVTAVGLSAAGLAWRHVYELHFTAAFFAAGAALVVPIYYYLPIIYALFKADRPHVVVLINLFGVGVNLAFNVWWLPRAGLLGAAWASAVAQWAMATFYLVWAGRLRRETNGIPVPDLP